MPVFLLGDINGVDEVAAGGEEGNTFE